jgi:hypothetical protein
MTEKNLHKVQSVLGCNAVYTHLSWLTFQRCVLPPSWGRWIALMVEAVCTSETSVNFNMTTVIDKCVTEKQTLKAITNTPFHSLLDLANSLPQNHVWLWQRFWHLLLNAIRMVWWLFSLAAGVRWRIQAQIWFGSGGSWKHPIPWQQNFFTTQNEQYYSESSIHCSRIHCFTQASFTFSGPYTSPI